MSPVVRVVVAGPRTPDVMRKFRNKLLSNNLTTQVPVPSTATEEVLD